MRRQGDKAWRLVCAAALLLAAGSVLLSVVLFVRLSHVSDRRRQDVLSSRSANCLVFEGDHLQEVQQLRQTYQFLTHKADGSPKPRSQWGELEKLVFKRSLPQLELDAKSDSDLHGAQVPKYCDEPGLGRPEPDPVVPRRPKSLK